MLLVKVGHKARRVFIKVWYAKVEGIPRMLTYAKLRLVPLKAVEMLQTIAPKSKALELLQNRLWVPR